MLVLAGLAVLWWWQGRRRQPAFAPDWSSYLTDRPDAEKTTAGVTPVAPGPAPAKVETPSPVAEVVPRSAPPVPAPSAGPIDSAAATAAEPAAPTAEDLTVIEGIGPKIAGLLRAAGITTLAELAAADVNRLRDILLAARLRLADPGSWPEQARLAAAGDWDALKLLQGQLKGGRRKSS